MAVDTEAKRWGMLQLASGPSHYPLVFNPDASGLSAIERATVLKLYGGIAFSSPATSAALSGTVTTATEAQIVAGGLTVILTLTNDTWVAAGAAFDAQRQNIIDGLDSAGAEATGWNAEVRDKEVVGAVVRTSDTVVTVTLTAAAAYAVTANETITATVPASALVTSAIDVTASPAFTVTAAAEVPTTTAGGGRILSAPTRRRKRLKRPPGAPERPSEPIARVIAPQPPPSLEALSEALRALEGGERPSEEGVAALMVRMGLETPPAGEEATLAPVLERIAALQQAAQAQHAEQIRAIGQIVVDLDQIRAARETERKEAAAQQAAAEADEEARREEDRRQALMLLLLLLD